MSMPESEWHLLPDLCLQRVCTYSRQLQTLFNLLLVCQNFYYALPIPKEFQRNWGAEVGYPVQVPHTLLKIIVRSHIPVTTVMWFVRIMGITRIDARCIAPSASLDVLRFFVNLYGTSPESLSLLDVDLGPIGPCSLSKMHFYLEELKIEVEADRKNRWFISACESGDVDCMEYVKNKLNHVVAADDAYFTLAAVCRTGSIDAVNWLMQTFQFAPELREQCGLGPACESGNIELVCYLRDKYNMGLRESDFFFGSSILESALKSDNIDLVYLVEKMYGDQMPKYSHSYIVSAIYEYRKGPTEKQNAMLDYVCDKYKIDPRTDDGVLLTDLCSHGKSKTLTALQEKFKLLKDDVAEWNLLSLADSYEMLRTLHNLFGYTKQDAQANNCELLRKACARGRHEIVEGLHELFQLSEEDATRCDAVKIAMSSGLRRHTRIMTRLVLRDLYGC